MKKIIELILGTSIIWLPIGFIALGNYICNLLNLGNIG